MAKKSKPAMMKVRQIRSGVGFPRGMRETVKALGLRRIRHTVECVDTRETRGMVAKVPHLVEVVE